MKLPLRQLVTYAAIAATLYASSFVTWSLMLGAHNAHFTLANIAWPLIGALFPLGLGAGLLSLLVGLKAVGFTALPLMSMTFGLPTLASMAVWSNSNKWADLLLRLVVPAACVMLFVAHPVGGQASLYTLYWFIPMTLAALNKKDILSRALSATFVAHAIGSVMWIYTVPTTSALWLGLIPVVAVERLSFALITAGMVMGMRTVAARAGKAAIIKD